MFKLNHVLRIYCKRYVKDKLQRRLCSAVSAVSDPDELSVRQKAWLEGQLKYAKFPHIFYSSYIESLVEHVPYNKRRGAPTVDSAALASLLQEVELRRSGKSVPQSDAKTSTETYPKTWMEDYEFYEGSIDEDGNINSSRGTPDPSILPSRVPCNGCGAHLHCANISLPGYIPREIFKGRTETELKTITCQRCHFLKNYNIALDVEVTSESYVETISRIKDKYALAVLIVDLLDLPCSIWPGMQEILGPKRPVFIVGNKVDLLPRDSNGYLEHIKSVLKQQLVHKGFDMLNVKNISLISAKTGYGVEEFITQLHKIWARKGDVYLLGCTNVGKSSLFNILLNSDYCRPEATDLVHKATTCPWPGTTLQMLKFPILKPSEIRVYYRFKRLFAERSQRQAEEKLRRDQARSTGSVQSAQLIGHVGRSFDKPSDVSDMFAMSSGTQPITTLNEKSALYKNCKWCFDTPGVLHPDQFTNLLTTEELLKLAPKNMIRPRALRLKPGSSLFLAGLGRLDYLGGSLGEHRWIRAFVFSSLQLPLLVVRTEHANEAYERYLGTRILGVPCGPSERMARWPGLQSCIEPMRVVGVKENVLSCDVVLSSAGWVGIEVPTNEECIFKAWSPKGRGIYMREPSLVPNAERLIGKHIRNTLAYNLNRPFVYVK